MLISTGSDPEMEPVLFQTGPECREQGLQQSPGAAWVERSLDWLCPEEELQLWRGIVAAAPRGGKDGRAPGLARHFCQCWDFNQLQNPQFAFSLNPVALQNLPVSLSLVWKTCQEAWGPSSASAPQERLLGLHSQEKLGRPWGFHSLDLRDLGFQEVLLVKATEGGLVECNGCSG